ncbi:MAG: DUF6512 family protein [Bacillota bacterium]|nr:DUF6512 family protein [Bacillota bacterium]
MSRKTLHILGVIFVLILGTLLHFTYKWSGGNNFVALFSATDESTFEHLKLLFWPFLIFTVIEYFVYGKEYGRFICIRLLSVLFGMAIIIVTFYTYTGVLGFNLLPLDIITFLLGVIGAFYLSYKLLHGAYSLRDPRQIFCTFIWIVMIACFIVWTFHPLNIGLFISPKV